MAATKTREKGWEELTAELEGNEMNNSGRDVYYQRCSLSV